VTSKLAVDEVHTDQECIALEGSTVRYKVVLVRQGPYIPFLAACMEGRTAKDIAHTLEVSHTDSGFSSLETAQTDQSLVLDLGWESD